jgi:hypothetical protein
LLHPIRVTFEGERAVDEGGPRRDWLTCLVRELFDPTRGIFEASPDGRSYQPAPASRGAEGLRWLRFAGRIIARALIDGICVPAHLSSGFLRFLRQGKPRLADLEAFDPEVHKSLTQILAMDDASAVGTTFVVTWDDGGVRRDDDLVPGGAGIELTNKNRGEYVQLIVEWHFRRQIEEQLKAFAEGLWGLIPAEEWRKFRAIEIDLLICGVPTIDVAEFRRHCHYTGGRSREDRTVQLFFEAIEKWSGADLAKLLQFMTGSSQLPVTGFRGFEESGHPISLSRTPPFMDMPFAHTCSYQLDLPDCQTVEQMDQILMLAIRTYNGFDAH